MAAETSIGCQRHGDALTLYDLLALSASPSPPLGETTITRAKETVDNDAEAFPGEEFLPHGR